MRSYLKAIFGGVALALALVPAAEARDITVPMDEVRIVTFPTPVSTVYVGNPAVADVTVIDARRVFLLGKNFGSTNLVALDSKGNPTISQRVTVFSRQGSTVTLHRGAAQMTFSCSGARCEAAPVPGDDNASYEAVMGQREKAGSQSANAADVRTPQ